MTEANAKRTKYLYRRTVKGNAYVYFRQPNGKLIPLPADERAGEFRRAYDACMSALTAKPTPAPAPKPVKLLRTSGSSAAPSEEASRFIWSPSTFKKNKPTTQHRYRISLDHMRDRIGTARLADLDIDGVDIYSEQLANETGPASADVHVSLLHNIWQVCRKFPEFGSRTAPIRRAMQSSATRRRSTPTGLGVSMRKIGSMESAPEVLKLAKLLFHFSAQRGGDCVKMRWTDFDGKGLFVMPEKGGVETEPNYHLCPKPLMDALSEGSEAATGPPIPSL